MKLNNLIKLLFISGILLSWDVHAKAPINSVQPMDDGFAEPVPYYTRQEKQIPKDNPHPPQTAKDKKRVDFAVAAIKQFLIDQNFTKTFTPQPIKEMPFYKNRACLETPACYVKDISFMTTVLAKIDNNRLVELRHPHVIPWSLDPNRKPQADPMSPKLEPGDFMVHTFALFESSGGQKEWYHLDVILSESATGEVGLKYFYRISIPTPGGNSGGLPPGVDC